MYVYTYMHLYACMDVYVRIVCICMYFSEILFRYIPIHACYIQNIYIQDMHIVQMYVFACIFDQIRHPLFQYVRIRTTGFTDVNSYIRFIGRVWECPWLACLRSKGSSLSAYVSRDKAIFSLPCCTKSYLHPL